MNPEKKVLDMIDQLVEESLKKPQDDYNAVFSETCEHCGFEWHGAPNPLGCPGAFGTDEQVAEWRENGPDAQHLVDDDGNVVLRGVTLIGSIVDGLIAMFPEQQALIALPPFIGEPPDGDVPEAFEDVGYVDMPQRQITFGFHVENASCQALWQENVDQDTPES